jgi:RNA polymerase sigma-70 factor (ECF subfamily)
MSNKKESIQTIALNFIKNKDNKSFSLLINRLKPGILSFAYEYVKDRDLANEVMSQVFIAIWEKIDQYKINKGNFSTWAYAIAKNMALGILKNKKQNISLDKFINNSGFIQTHDSLCNINNEYINLSGENLIEELYDVSISAIKHLPEPYKTVLIEREINQKHLSDIAEDLGWNLSTVKTRLRKARKDVAEILYKKYPDLVDSYFGNEN